jgi:RNA polymerase sigma factor (sigma-70 family)
VSAAGRDRPGRPPKRSARGDEQLLFEQYADRLVRVVQRALRAPRHIVEEACSFAWLQLVRVQPEREAIFAWLRVVATREALRLLRQESRCPPVDQAEIESDRFAEASSEDLCAERSRDRLSARQALELITALPPRQARVMVLHVAGYTYEEISAQTGDSRRTVERQLIRARAQIRAAESEGGE